MHAYVFLIRLYVLLWRNGIMEAQEKESFEIIIL